MAGLVVAAFALPACTPSEQMRSQWAAAQEEQEAQLAAAGARWQTLYQAGDWEALRSLYTDDAVLMTQGQPKIEGADNIIAFLRRVPNAGGTVQFQFENEEVVAESAYANPHYGVVTAKYLMTITFPGQAPVEVAGRSLLIYKWQDGEWLLWRDIDNLAPDAKPEDFAS
ncbi:YybH family protein [Altererythrobacter sp. GH1-8]|uniref:YybH family protein n=1 Tax=Altererythrobacter sp. GH1-8 TaxID=3349333 RepID=UPI00374C9442